MQLRKYRWSKDYESAEEELRALLDSRHIQAERCVAEDGDMLPAVAHSEDIRVWCAEGMFSLTAEGKTFSMQPGDTIDIPAALDYTITGRFGGCVWYQAAA